VKNEAFKMDCFLLAAREFPSQLSFEDECKKMLSDRIADRARELEMEFIEHCTASFRGRSARRRSGLC